MARILAAPWPLCKTGPQDLCKLPWIFAALCGVLFTLPPLP